VIPHFWVYVTTVVLGLTVLAWPEEDSRMLLTLSERQGPSALDLFGLTSRPSWWCPRFCALDRVIELGLAGTCPSGGGDTASGCRAIPDRGP